jgi:hypothetical protein
LKEIFLNLSLSTYILDILKGNKCVCVPHDHQTYPAKLEQLKVWFTYYWFYWLGRVPPFKPSYISDKHAKYWAKCMQKTCGVHWEHRCVHTLHTWVKLQGKHGDPMVHVETLSCWVHPTYSAKTKLSPFLEYANTHI